MVDSHTWYLFTSVDTSSFANQVLIRLLSTALHMWHSLDTPIDSVPEKGPDLPSRSISIETTFQIGSVPSFRLHRSFGASSIPDTFEDL